MDGLGKNCVMESQCVEEVLDLYRLAKAMTPAIPLKTTWPGSPTHLHAVDTPHQVLHVGSFVGELTPVFIRRGRHAAAAHSTRLDGRILPLSIPASHFLHWPVLRTMLLPDDPNWTPRQSWCQRRTSPGRSF